MQLEVQIDVLAPRHSIESGFVEAELSDLSITTRSPRPLTPPLEEEQQRPPSPSTPRHTQLPPLLKRLFSTKRQPLGRQRAARSTIKKQRPMTGYELAKAVSDTCLSRPRPEKGVGVSRSVSRRNSRRPSVEQLDAGLLTPKQDVETGVACGVADVTVNEYSDLDSVTRRHSYQPHRSRCLSVADFDRIENYTHEKLGRPHSEPCILTPVYGACIPRHHHKSMSWFREVGRDSVTGQDAAEEEVPETGSTVAEVHLLDIPIH